MAKNDEENENQATLPHCEKYVNTHPLINKESSHYSMFDGVEAIERMEALFTTKDLMAWAKLTSFKYRLRIGKKEQVDSSSDVKKIITYEKYYNYLEKKLKQEEIENGK